MPLRCWSLAVVQILLGVILAQPAQAQVGGKFKGEVVASFMRDGRNMKLEKPFGYVDPHGRSWDVPAGAITDGASIPRVLWVSYPPFTGKYRAAAVVHDWYCQTKERSWRDTHEVFYSAMRTAGVEDNTAKVMYAAVYYFGPRWGIGSAKRGPGAERGMTAKEEQEFLKRLETIVENNKPSLAEIGKLIDDGGLE